MCTRCQGLSGKFHRWSGEDCGSGWEYMHPEQPFARCSMSLSCPGHQKYPQAKLLIFMVPRCPSFSCYRTRIRSFFFLETITLVPHSRQSWWILNCIFHGTYGFRLSLTFSGQPWSVWWMTLDMTGSFLDSLLMSAELIGSTSIISV